MPPTARWPAPEAGRTWGAVVSRHALALTAGAALAWSIGPAEAQSRGEPPCVLDKCLGRTAPSRPDEAPAPEPAEPPASSPSVRGSVAPGAFDFYVLALSWSPGFCETGGAEKAQRQCEPGSRLGFVVHGLWPQNTRGYPSDCNANAPAPSRLALDSVRGLYPDDGLARYEWRKHGTCTGLAPAAYFADVQRARAAIVIPEPFRSPEDQRSWAPLDIARAFTASNPRLRTDAMAVTCRGNTLQEVRICFSKDLRGFVSCPEIARASCRRPIDVPPVM